MAQVQEVTTLDKLMIVPHVTRVLTSAVFRLLTAPFVGGPKANTLFKDVIFAALRTHLTIIRPGTEQWINPTTEATYLDVAKKEKFQPDTTVLDSGLKLHWLGPKSADKILLYFHGGGYVGAANPGQFQWAYEVQNEVTKSHSLSVVFLAYTLAPHGQYPKQLQEAAEALDWLLTTQKKKPSDIIIAGDSAGGNLALSLISHLLHPHPQVSHKINLSEPLLAAVLISPWAKFATDDDSVKRNATSDMVTPTAANRWSSLFLGSQPLDNYNQPILADLNWFNGLNLKAKDILVWGGGGECLIDSIEAIGKKLKEASLSTELVVQPGAGHEDFLFDTLLGYKQKAEGTKLIESWLASKM